MGIKGIHQLLKKYNLYEEVSLYQYAYKKIAIDAPYFVCVFKLRENYIESIIDMIVILRSKHIHPVFVFDGKAPIEKAKERERRAQKKADQYARIERLEADYEEYKISKIVSLALKEINEKKIKPSRLFPNSTRFSDIAVENYIKKLRSHMLKVTEEDFNILKKILYFFKIPTIFATGEGEVLCAQLAKQGLVDAVLTKDTDVLACSTPVMLNGFGTHTFVEIRIDDILDKLNLTEKSWIDLCIMCGTDFNDNIPRIGPMKAYSLILKYKNIENIPLDITILHHERTRELFTHPKYEKKIPFCGILDFNSFSKFVIEYNLFISPDTIQKKLIQKIVFPKMKNM